MDEEFVRDVSQPVLRSSFNRRQTTCTRTEKSEVGGARHETRGVLCRIVYTKGGRHKGLYKQRSDRNIGNSTIHVSLIVYSTYKCIHVVICLFLESFTLFTVDFHYSNSLPFTSVEDSDGTFQVPGSGSWNPRPLVPRSPSGHFGHKCFPTDVVDHSRHLLRLLKPSSFLPIFH